MRKVSAPPMPHFGGAALDLSPSNQNPVDTPLLNIFELKFLRGQFRKSNFSVSMLQKYLKASFDSLASRFDPS